MSTERPSSESPTAIFETGEIFSEWDDAYYHPLALRLFDSAIPRMLEMLGAQPGDLVLDAGCGPGAHSIRAARFGCRVQSVDVSNTVLEEAAARAEAAGVGDSITFGQQDLTQLSLPDESFDRVFSWGVLTHIPDIETALGELCRTLRPGGRLALEVTNMHAWDYKIEAIARRVLRRPGNNEELLKFGLGRWYTGDDGERLWVWHMDVEALTRHLSELGLRRTHRLAMNLTNLQRRLGGVARRCLLHANNAWFARGLPAGPAATNLLVFEKAPLA